MFINFYRASREHHVRDRIRCVLLFSDDWTLEKNTHSKLIHQITRRRHRNDWLNGEKLAPKNRGSDSHLSKEKTTALIRYLTNNLPTTTQSIIERIAEWWGIRYTVTGMTQWLHRNSFSYRKPSSVPQKYCVEAQQTFIKPHNELKEKFGDDDPILLLDRVHPTKGTKQPYDWMPAGKKSQSVGTTDSCTRLNIMKDLNLNESRSTVVQKYDNMISFNIARFFIAIRELYSIRRKLHIILDGVGYHRAELVKEWAYMINIDLHYLPPYSPNLNPIERLWKVINEQMRNNRHLASAKVFQQEIHCFFHYMTETGRSFVTQDS